MPTGYTAKLYDGTEKSFRTFMLRLAGAFGAMIEFRDSGYDVDNFPDNVRPVSSYHSDNIKRSEEELKTVQSWSKEEAQQKADEQYKKDLDYYYNNQVKENNERLQRYDNMLIQIKNWTPPTDQHHGIKKMAIEQIEESINYDCHTPDVPRRKTGEEFKKEKLDSIHWSLNYHREYAIKEIESSKDSNLWIKALVKSLPKE